MMPLPLNLVRISGAASLGLAIEQARRPAPTDHAVARDPNPQPSPDAPAGRLGTLLAPAEKMEIHILDERALATREEGRFSTWLDAQFNPTEISEHIVTVWNDITVPLYERRHYSHTKCPPFKFELAFDGYEFLETNPPAGEPRIDAGAEYIDKAVNFLRSLGYHDEATGSPPRCLFYWPNFISLTATADEIAFKHADWAPSGHLMRFTAAITLREIRDRNLSRNNVLLAGNRRTSPPTGVIG